MSTNHPNNLKTNNSGTILVIVAVFLPVALILLAISLNLGTLYYTKSAFTSIGETATASALSLLGDEMTKIVDEKMHATPPYIPVSPDVWDNLTDEERPFLTTDSTIVNEIKSAVTEYLNKNITSESIMRNDLTVHDIEITYPYNYHLNDRFVKVHLEFKVTAPISLIKNMSNKEVLIKSESQLRIK